jgi:rare lipoprotein A
MFMAFPATVRHRSWPQVFLLMVFLLSLGQGAAADTPGQTGIASWYGHRHNGRRTANGEIHDSRRLTAAHRGLPFGTVVRVTNLASGAQVVVRINDRGPYVQGRVIDLSELAARRLGLLERGTAPVRIEIVGRN